MRNAGLGEAQARIKIAGTPYLLIDGEEYRGAITSYDTLTELLKD